MSENRAVPGTLEDLAGKHKAERKELQAKIQGLKKSATKGDKKKKKEVQEEIARLELELEKRHEEEEAAFKQDLSFDNSQITRLEDEGNQEEINMIDEPIQRISKAQKRRHKKAAADQERDARVQEQEVENLQGPRHQEGIAIANLLKKRGLALHTIVADGNCLYSAIEHQLKQTDGPHANLDFKALRKYTANYLRENQNDFLPFMSHPDTGDQLTEKQFHEYCRKVECTTAWGGQIEIRALSNVLQHPIEVIQATGPPMIIGEEYGPQKKMLTVTFHRYMYRLGEHYNSVIPFTGEDSEETA